MKLTKLQLAFIKRHKIDSSEIFDATGMSKSEYSSVMSNEGYSVAVGVTKCMKGGHSIRNRSGHCVMCRPECLAYQKRYYSDADLYVLYSPSSRLVKVGVAKSAVERQKSANEQSYGNVTDWKLKFSITVTNAGYAEKLVHDKLSRYRKKEYFSKDGRLVLAQEMFSTTVKNAIEIINSIIE